MPTYRPTNAGLQTKGTLFGGFDPTVSTILAGCFMGNVMLTFGSISALHTPWYIVVPFFFILPNAVLVSVVFFLIMGKPKRYLRDWFESRLLGRSEVDLNDIAEPPRIDLNT
jgi:hypothetical protein